jgi:hypothetical protein
VSGRSTCGPTSPTRPASTTSCWAARTTSPPTGHFIPDEDDPYGITGRLLDALPSGSHLALSHLTGDFDPEAWEGVAAIYRRSGVIMRVRSLPEIERFFDGLDLVEPGVVSLPRWRPDPGAGGGADQPTDAEVSVYGGVARKP